MNITYCMTINLDFKKKKSTEHAESDLYTNIIKAIEKHKKRVQFF